MTPTTNRRTVDLALLAVAVAWGSSYPAAKDAVTGYGVFGFLAIRFGIAVLGLAFKAGTDDMREAPSLSIIPALEERGAPIAAFDQKSFEQARPSLPNTEFAHDARSALKDADAAIILTEWPEFSTLTPADFKSLMRQQVVFEANHDFTEVVREIVAATQA